jgi:hypothetical protein
MTHVRKFDERYLNLLQWHSWESVHARENQREKTVLPVIRCIAFTNQNGVRDRRQSTKQNPKVTLHLAELLIYALR